jgi:rod shape determining protein RodA
MTATPIHDASESRAPIRLPGLLPFDGVLMLAVIGIAVCSLAAIHAATAGGHGYLPNVRGNPDFYVTRQAIYFVVGGLLALGISRIDYSRLRELKYVLYAVLMASILLVLGAGSAALGAQRAIALPGFSFQASELGKLLLVVVLAAFVVDRSRRLRERDTTARVMLLALVPAVFVMAQPDLGSALVYIAIALAVLYIAGTSWQHFAALFALGAVAIALVLVAAPAVGVHPVKQYQLDRLTAFLHPSDNPAHQGYQQHQSQIAIGSGEKTGRGQQATQTKLRYVPENYTDFVNATIGERWGFVGCALILSLFGLIIWRGLRILTMAKNLYGALIAGGIVAMLMFQVFINVGMTLGIMPITGIPLPMVSYGGSSVVTTLLAVGLLQSIYAQGRRAAALKGRILTL